MYVEFDSLSNRARVWVYQASKKLSAKNKSDIVAALIEFTENWNAHGHPLKSSFAIREDLFVILAADEEFNETSGCSIDSSVHAIKQLSERIGVNFFDRQMVVFQFDEETEFIPIKELQQKFETGIWNGHTLTFNTLAQTVEDIRKNWRLQAKDSWLKRFMRNTQVM